MNPKSKYGQLVLPIKMSRQNLPRKAYVHLIPINPKEFNFPLNNDFQFVQRYDKLDANPGDFFFQWSGEPLQYISKAFIY